MSEATPTDKPLAQSEGQANTSQDTIPVNSAEKEYVSNEVKGAADVKVVNPFAGMAEQSESTPAGAGSNPLSTGDKNGEEQDKTVGENTAEDKPSDGDTNQAADTPVSDVKPVPMRTPPAGWLECENAGKPVGRVIPIKVPLQSGYTVGDKGWNCDDLIAHGKKLGTEIGLIIDLTFTDKYYDRKTCPVRVEKLAIPGRVIPSQRFVDQFSRIITDFTRANPGKYVAVHCTHGHNRTGFMVVSHMLLTRRISLNDALDLFTRARPPGLYRQGLRDALFERFRTRATGPPRAIPAPPWEKRREENEGGGDDRDRSDHRLARRENWSDIRPDPRYHGGDSGDHRGRRGGGWRSGGARGGRGRGRGGRGGGSWRDDGHRRRDDHSWRHNNHSHQQQNQRPPPPHHYQPPPPHRRWDANHERDDRGPRRADARQGHDAPRYMDRQGGYPAGPGGWRDHTAGPSAQPPRKPDRYRPY